MLQQLMRAFRCLPGVGPKSAQRMTFHLLQRDREGARRLAETLLKALDTVGYCRECRTLTESEVCGICASTRRDRALLCVVESPAEMDAISRATGYQGLFFVLNGRLSPLDGVGPRELRLDLLESRLKGERSERSFWLRIRRSKAKQRPTISMGWLGSLRFKPHAWLMACPSEESWNTWMVRP